MKALRQCCDDARLAEARLAGDQNDLAVTGLGTGQAAQQQVDLFVAADQPGLRRSTQRLEPARNDARAQYPPSPHWPGDALDLDGAEIAVVEEIANQPARARGNDDRVRFGQGLQTGGEVRRLTDDRLLLRRAFADQIADDHQPGRDPDPRLQFDGFDIEATDSVDDTQPGAHPPLGVVLMRPRVAEIDQNAVAHVLGDKPIEAPDDVGDGAMIRADHLAQILGIEPCRERGRTDQIAEHHRQLPTLGIHPHPSPRRRRGEGLGRGFCARRARWAGSEQATPRPSRARRWRRAAAADAQPG